MRIHHIAIWTKDLEKMKKFYLKYFNCESNDKYTNVQKSFESYFLKFIDGSRLELMKMPTIPDNLNDANKQNLGLIHFAISVGKKETVDALTEKLKEDGYIIISAPRTTGDGFYESCVLDPENNRIEITI